MQAVSPRVALENKVRYGGSNILALGILTLVGVVMAATGSEMYFPYCFFTPYFITLVMAIYTGKFSDEYYEAIEWDPSMGFLPSTYFVVGIVISILMVAGIALVYVLSLKKKKTALLVGAVLYSIDTGLLLLKNGIDLTLLIDYLLHGVALFYLWSGYSAVLKLEKMPPEQDSTAAEPSANEYAGYSLSFDELPAEDTVEPKNPRETPSDEFKL
jgi:hypothetical protein